MTDRIIDAALLVERVVSPGAIGAREPDIELLVVEFVPRQVQRALADIDDPAAVTQQRRRTRCQIGIVAARRDEDAIDAAAGCQLVDPGTKPGRGIIGCDSAGCGARSLRLAAACLEPVQPDHHDTSAAQQAHQDLPDQAEADHAGRLAKTKLRLAHRLQRDRGDRGERGLVERGAIRHRNAEIHWHPIVFGVRRILIAAAADPLPHRETSGALAYFNNRARQRVTEWRIGIEAVHHLLIGHKQALLADRARHLGNLVGARARLAEQRQATFGKLHHLGAGRHRRECRAHQDPAGATAWRRHIDQPELAGLIVLRDLLHSRSTASS